MDRRRPQPKPTSTRSTSTTTRSSSARTDASPRSVPSRRPSSRSEYSKGRDTARKVSHTELDIFDPIDYVVEDNVLDLREARYQRLHKERKRQNNFDGDWQEQL